MLRQTPDSKPAILLALGICVGLICGGACLPGKSPGPEPPAEFVNQDGHRFVLLEFPETLDGEVVIGGQRYPAEELLVREPKPPAEMSGVTRGPTTNDTGDQCAARRLDATYASFIESYSEY